MNNAKTILLVEDELILRAIYILQLEQMGFQVVDVGDGEAALDYLAHTEALPACVLTDYNLPGISGGDLIIALHAEPRTASLPTILMSSNDRIEHIAKNVQSTCFLTKPFEIEVLGQCLTQILASINPTYTSDCQ